MTCMAQPSPNTRPERVVRLRGPVAWASAASVLFLFGLAASMAATIPTGDAQVGGALIGVGLVGFSVWMATGLLGNTLVVDGHHLELHSGLRKHRPQRIDLNDVVAVTIAGRHNTKQPSVAANRVLWTPSTTTTPTWTVRMNRRVWAPATGDPTNIDGLDPFAVQYTLMRAGDRAYVVAHIAANIAHRVPSV